MNGIYKHYEQKILGYYYGRQPLSVINARKLRSAYMTDLRQNFDSMEKLDKILYMTLKARV